MRITGGAKKGCRLISPKGDRIRPSSDHIRQAIFNIIGHRLSGKKVLDLFAGTGSLGIEALSRGADFACFVDNSLEAIRLIQRNLEITGYKSKAKVIKMDIIKGDLGKIGEGFDLIFIDPPYERGLFGRTLERLLMKKALFKESSLIIARSSKRESFPCFVNCIELKKRNTYGDTVLWIMLHRK